MSTTNRIRLRRSDSNDPDFQNLTSLLDHDLRNMYGLLQPGYDYFNHVGDVDTVVIAYLDDKPAGCGCFKKFSDNTIEIKRMFVKPGTRGQGIATRILDELESWAMEKKFTHSILETGRKQAAAIHLYSKSGYAITINYGPYGVLDNSVCMRKKL
jgi:putative acetyltransferase